MKKFHVAFSLPVLYNKINKIVQKPFACAEGGKGCAVKNKTFLQSAACAVKGLILALRTEKNFRYYLGITLSFLLVNLLVGVEFSCYMLQAVTTMGVFSSECTNTAIERLCNRTTSEVDPEIKAIKDIAAGAVLCWGIAFFMLEFVFIGRALLC